MSIMAWNVRGLGSKETVRALRNAAFKFKPCIIFLSETKKKRRYVEKVRIKLKLQEAFYVDPTGIAGDLSLWWNTEVKLNVLKADKNFIDAKVFIEGEADWFITFIYGPPYSNEKEEFWQSISCLRMNRNENWCIIGDTDVVAKPEEKLGGLPFEASNAKWFYDFMDYTCLMELPIKGGMFTWSNRRSEDEAILEKLDRVMVSCEWSLNFPKAIGILDVALASYHTPIVLMLKGANKRYKRDFKFEAKWLLEEECSSNIRESWQPGCRRGNNQGFGLKLCRTRSRIPESFLGTDTAPEYRYPGTGIDTCRRGFDTSSVFQPPTASLWYRYSTSSTDTLGSRIAEKACLKCSNGSKSSPTVTNGYKLIPNHKMKLEQP
ncbi:hypothetical protein GQ457_02G017580 [Hibiscus cannabinus]